MGNNDKDIIERWGRLFKRANFGMDEEQVASFVNELMRERDMLVRQQEHLFSLIRLAEKAAGGADNMASQGLKEAVGQPNEQIRQMMGEKKTEAVAKPAKEAEINKVNAQQLQELIGTAGQPNGDEPDPDWEVQILPPIDIMQALKVMTSLDSLPEIAKTELIPDIKKPLIAVFVHKPTNLVDALKRLSQVAEVKGDGANGAGADGKPRKVQIVLSEKAISEKGK